MIGRNLTRLIRPFEAWPTLVCSSSWHNEGHKNMNITWEFHYVIHTNCGTELLTGTKHWKSCPNCYPRRHIFRMIYVNVWAMLWWGGNLSLDTYSSRWHKVGHKNLNRTFILSFSHVVEKGQAADLVSSKMILLEIGLTFQDPFMFYYCNNKGFYKEILEIFLKFI